jgi:hypothetical protein
MSKTKNDTEFLLPSDTERQKIFYWLKKISSITAWRRVFEYYKIWATATENSLRVADENGWGDDTSLPHAEYALILKCLAHCEEGVIRLSKGDKRVFKFDANGEFAMAARMLSHWTQMLERIELGENGIREHTPLWPEFCQALTALGQAWGECAQEILEPRYFEDPAQTLYGKWLQKQLQTMPFPPELVPVPDPIDNTFVRTGDDTPCSGIWEPIDVPKISFISLVTRSPKPQPPFKITGAMNYLHMGAKAPQISVETANDSFELDTTWRLLWRDDRYNDGNVPAEEAGYRFTKPDKLIPPGPAITVLKNILWAESGDVAKVGGKWLVESDLNASITLQQGEKLPQHIGRDVRWVLAES